MTTKCEMTLRRLLLLQIVMLEDVISERAADAAEKRQKQTTSVDNSTSDAVVASNKSLSNMAKLYVYHSNLLKLTYILIKLDRSPIFTSAYRPKYLQISLCHDFNINIFNISRNYFSMFIILE